jgi:uncharacterized protein YyaL (SSP411 family)
MALIRGSVVTVLALACGTIFSVTPVFAADQPAWQNWTDGTFARAQAEHRFVLLDLQAVWCHWCHVMEQTTYADRKVDDIIAGHYVAVRVDQDANPDLSNRYGEWGWPATIVFGPDGTEIVKLRGYVPPERMASILDAIVKDASPGPSVARIVDVKPSGSAFLPASQRENLIKTLDAAYDTKHGSWGTANKYIDADSMDFTLTKVEKGDAAATAKAKQTFNAALALIDPVWGGVYQYSEAVDWKSPHFEKIISFQAQYLRQYALAYAFFKDPKYLEAATSIERYLTTFLRDDGGGFYVSQDADLNDHVDGHAYYALADAERRKLGIPPIDRHIYARESGWAISGLAAYANATGDHASLEMAEQAARWISANRGVTGGGFRHGENDRGGPFLGDTVAMGQAFIDLYAASGDRGWLDGARQASGFIAATFKDAGGGFLTAKTSEARIGVLAKPAKLIDEQIQVVRFTNLLNRYTGDPADRALAEHGMRYLAGAAMSIQRPLPGILLADQEVAVEPTHVTVVGHKDDPKARLLYAAARALPAVYKRLDWWDKRQGPLPNNDVEYPEMDEAAAFACSDHLCSYPPSTTAEELKAAVELMAKRRPSVSAK